MEIQKLGNSFTVCKITSVAVVDLTKKFTFLSITDDEISLVCESSSIPANTTAVEPDWRGLKICGVLDFGMVGVIAEISRLLAENSISIFVVSTYNTDYIFIKSVNFENAIAILRANGYDING